MVVEDTAPPPCSHEQSEETAHHPIITRLEEVEDGGRGNQIKKKHKPINSTLVFL
ncbi:hypothetical protein A2U01_0034011 [Trifolium medium]|uniref:Uncharacterized protein n=1 Tax=Trifolium medium TaxID=97028 RepID=A0A392PLC8_9FABA|nr:hypothetical protein [Trifolium medium]